MFSQERVLHNPAKGLDRRDVLRLQADAPVKNTGKTRYNGLIKNYKLLIKLERRGNARGYFISR
jgi:hypothetical protein